MNGITTAFTARLGQDPEMRYSTTGKAMLSFSAAVDESYTADADRPPPETTWVRCVVWGEQAEALSEHLRKGSQVYCEGRLRLERWTSKEGEPRSGLAVSCWRCDVHGQIGQRGAGERVGAVA